MGTQAYDRTTRADRRSGARRDTAPRYRAYTRANFEQISHIQDLSLADRTAIRAVSAVLPFRVNNYVTDRLIDWSNVPDDPIYQLTFPQPGMLDEDDFVEMAGLVERQAPAEAVTAAARRIQDALNPHPAAQMELNVPLAHDEPVPGLQHKYRETVLFFPAQGQTCHAYCTYCFRWAQFVKNDELKFAAREADRLVDYVAGHQDVTNVIFTGGDPLIMRTEVLRRYVEPLLREDLEHVESIRIGTKAPAYWPYRFFSDPDAADLLRLFERVRDAGKHLALMVHYSHPRELQTPEAERAVRAMQDAGAVIRCQAPVIRHVNDRADDWAELWRLQTRLGAVPYYMFVERDTGPRNYFAVPLVETLRIFNDAYRQVSGLGRTVRGPSMSATPGKVLVDGVTEVGGRPVLALKFLQARDPDWVGRVFFAEFDPGATWLDELAPAFGEREFFFEEPLREMRRQRRTGTPNEPALNAAPARRVGRP